MQRDDLIKFLVNEIVSRKSEKPPKIGIDGKSAAGKTTIADDLGQVLKGKGFEVLRPSVDGFHFSRARRYRQGEFSAKGYYSDAYDYETLKKLLLEPLSGNAFPVTCRLVNHDIRAEASVEAPSVMAGKNTILLFDGIFLTRHEINSYWDYRILLSIDAGTSLSRALVRDAKSMGSTDLIRRKYAERYEPAWEMYQILESPNAKVDVVIDNNDFTNPQILNARQYAVRACGL